MSDTLNFREKKLSELRDICRGDPQKYYGFSKLKKLDLIQFMYQRNSTIQRSRNPISRPLYYLSDCSHIFETAEESEERIQGYHEPKPEDSIIEDLVSSLRREYPRCTITFDENNDEYSDMIYKGNKGKYIQKHGDLGEYGEQVLYHGTDEKNLISILNDDFRLTNNPVHGHMYGKGIYFTNDIDKAIYYSERGRSTKYILVCNVHIGDICLGNARMDIHPRIPDYLNKDKTYDTSVDNIHSPKQFIKKKNGTYNILGILKIKNYKNSQNKQNNQYTGSFQIINTLEHRVTLYWVPDYIVNTLPNVDLNKCKLMSNIPRSFNSNPGALSQLCQIGHIFVCVLGYDIIRIIKSKKRGEKIII